MTLMEPMQRRRVLCARPLSLVRNSRRPVRRSLAAELGKSDKTQNLKFARDLLTIQQQEFIQKYNFDPVECKPVAVVDSSSVDSVVRTSNTPKYEWEQMPRIKRTLEDVIECVHNKKFSNTNKVVSSVCSLETSTNSKLPAVTKPSTVAEGKSIAVNVKENEDRPATNGRDDKDIKLSTDEQESAAVSVVLSSGAARNNSKSTVNLNNNTIYRQSKITDFATHRKPFHLSINKEEADLQPPSKRPKLAC